MSKEIIMNFYNDSSIKKQAIPGLLKKLQPSIYNLIIESKVTGSFVVKAYCYIHNIITQPLCLCGKPTTFVSMSKGFSRTCSCKCMGLYEDTKEKRINTVLQNHGVSNISLVTRDKASHTMRNKTIEERQLINQKVKNTSLLLYGVDNINKLETISERKRKTNYERRGVEYPTQCFEVVTLREKNNLFKYGVPNPIQVSEFFEKQQHQLYAIKEYMWKTGEISKVRGYEPIVLKELEDNGYSYDDVKTSAKDMPCVWYYYKGKKRRYYPDLYIPKENLIIEVKSTYTNNCNIEINQLKYEAVKKLGFNFRLEIR